MTNASFASSRLLRSASLALWTLLTLWTPHASGYGQGTEQFIPIGQSPGVSGTLSVQGTLTWTDPGTMRLCVREIFCTHYTHAMSVYLDRSHFQRPNTVGAWRDLHVGQTVEVYPQHWIKIRVEEAP